jgi:hypothetical protein
MNREDHRLPGRFGLDECKRTRESFWIVRGFGPMQRAECKRDSLKPKAADDGRPFARRRRGVAHGVVHDIADRMHAMGYSFAAEVLDSGSSGTQQKGRYVVRDNSIDLFGHPTIKRPQAGFHMNDRYVQLGCGQGAGKR